MCPWIPLRPCWHSYWRCSWSSVFWRSSRKAFEIVLTIIFMIHKQLSYTHHTKVPTNVNSAMPRQHTEISGLRRSPITAPFRIMPRKLNYSNCTPICAVRCSWAWSAWGTTTCRWTEGWRLTCCQGWRRRSDLASYSTISNTRLFKVDYNYKPSHFSSFFGCSGSVYCGVYSCGFFRLLISSWICEWIAEVFSPWAFLLKSKVYSSMSLSSS